LNARLETSHLAHFSFNSRFHVAFTISTVCGWIAGSLIEGKLLLLGKQDTVDVLSVILIGGFLGATIYGSSFRSRAFLLLFCLPYVALVGQSVAFYLSFRNYVFTPELFVPTAFAMLPFYFIYSHFRRNHL
jgi:hypothetical protein